MKKIALILLVLALLAAGLYFFWQRRNSHFTQVEIDQETQESAEQMSSENDLMEEADEYDEVLDLEDEAAENADEYDEDEFESDQNDYISPVVTAEHCKEGCQEFSNQDEKKYCLDYCGLNEADGQTSDDCEKLEKFSRDSCFKQKAIGEKSHALCEKISDDGLQESCKNRVLEEILDEN